MKRSLCWAGFLFLVSGAVVAQETPAPETPAQDTSRAELFGGYSYASADFFSVNHRTGLQGWSAALNLHAAKWLGLMAEVSGYYGTSNLPVITPAPFPPCPPFCPSSTTTFSVNTRAYTYLFGPQFNYRRWEKFTPFARGLLGGAHVTGEVQGFTESDSRGTFAVGAGADYRISPKLSWRVQADYLPTRFFKRNQENFRVSAGIVFRFAGKRPKARYPAP